MKLIPLSQGKFAKVDDEDYDYLMQWRWYAHKTKSLNSNEPTFYARRSYIDDGIKKSQYMHRNILNILSSDKIADHKDHDGLNNQKNNLRVTDKRHNAVNQRPMRGSSKFLGVSIYTYKNRNGQTKKKWKVQISISEGIRKHLAYFEYNESGEIEAAKYYDKKALEVYGEFANLNFKL